MALKGWNQKLMMSLYKKETSYGSTVTCNATNFCSITEHSDYNPDWADKVQDNKDVVTGTEHGTDLEILAQGFKLSLTQPRAKPNLVIGAIGAALGNITSTTDGTYTAYRHYIVPVDVGTALPSFNVIGLKGGMQYLHKGCKVNSFTLSGEAEGAVAFEVEIIGAGDRTTNADSFVAEPSESWLQCKNGYIWRESGPNIAIDATNTQGLANISSSTPTDLKARIKKFNFKWNNNLEGIGFGAGSGGTYSDLDYKRRSAELALTLSFNDASEIAFYEAATALACEIEIKGALIVVGGSMYYGMDLIVSRFKLKKAPLPQGGVNDLLTCEYTCDIEDDGTNPAVKFAGYNAKAAYLA
jgi:hypothetical protein